MNIKYFLSHAKMPGVYSIPLRPVATETHEFNPPSFWMLDRTTTGMISQLILVHVGGKNHHFQSCLALDATSQPSGNTVDTVACVLIFPIVT